MQFGIYEKKNRHALHGIYSSKESAERSLRDVIPIHCARGYFMDKTLRPDSFEVRAITRATEGRK